jgi:nicotinate phosphoribosyltransferase
VAYDDRPVRKTSSGKAIWPGPKQVWRAADWSGDVLALAEEPPPSPDHQPLLVEAMADGRRTTAGGASLAQANQHFEHQWKQLPKPLKSLSDPPGYPLEPSSALERLTRQIDARLGRQPDNSP